LRSDLKVFVAVPWLYGEVYESCLKHIENQKCQVETTEPYYVKPRVSFDPKRDKKKKPALSAANVNWYINKFLQSDATHFWMIDADAEVPENALCDLIKMDVDIASGVSFSHNRSRITTAGRWFPAPSKNQRSSKPFFKFLAPNQILGRKIGSKQIVVGTGAFCLLCKRRVFEKPHPRIKPLRFRWNEPQAFGIDLTFWFDAQTYGFSARINGNVLCGHLPDKPLEALRKIKWK